LNASFARRQASVAPGKACHAVCFSAVELPLRGGQSDGELIPRGIQMVFSAQRHWCLLVASLPVRGCSIICDEQPLHIQPGHRRVASLRHCALVALAVPHQRLILSSRHGASQLLGHVRPAARVPAAVAVVAAVRIQLSPPHRLVAVAAP